MPEPLISVVIPAYNGEAYLDQAIESALAQTWPRTEVVVVDDGSTDRTAQIAGGYPVKLLRQDNRGVATARNQGAAAAVGELLNFLDQDDILLPEKLERQMETLSADPAAGICACRARLFLEPGLPRPSWVNPDLLEGEHHSLLVGAMLIRRSAFESVGPFAASYRWANDTDWFVRAREAGVSIARLDETLFRYRVHDHNESRRGGVVMRDALKVFRASIHRRRAEGGHG